MPTMYIEILPEDEGGEREVIRKHGHALHLLTEAKRLIRHHGDSWIGHINICMHDGEDP